VPGWRRSRIWVTASVVSVKAMPKPNRVVEMVWAYSCAATFTAQDWATRSGERNCSSTQRPRVIWA
jgi:hypothetical protein